ncbi:hypothetical protein R3P38DRAFT_2630999, partial [Favolaschia claudopus]
MAPSGRIPHNPSRQVPSTSSSTSLRLLVRRNTKATPTPKSLTEEQIEEILAKVTDKNQQGISQPWTAVPNPVPDTGIHPAAVHRVQSLSLAEPTSSTSSQSVSSYLLQSPSLVTTSTSSTQSLITSTTAILTPGENQNNNRSQSSTTHRLPTPAITLISIAGTFFLLAIFVTVKLCLYPPRRPRLVPSRPILDDPFPSDEEFETKLEDSPIFGGKERLSERPGNSGLWTWTQYTTPANRPDSTAAVDHLSVQRKFSYTASSGKNNASTEAVILPGLQASVAPVYPTPMQQVHSTLTRAASQLSTVSAYPATLSNDRNMVTSFTADGHPVMERITPRVVQRSRSSTVGDRSHLERLKVNRHSSGFAYDGAEIKSPTLPSMPSVPGRTRIKSSYYAHPRTSAMPPSQSTKAHLRHDNLPPLHQKSASRSTRDTKMVSPLGFGSPATVYPSSPQPTLYPDDSLSIVEAKRAHKPVHKKPPPSNRSSRILEQQGPPASPTVDATAALGNLMLLDFGGTGESAANLASASSMMLKKASRSDDKPPRVPSPPPLPSLTQMALEHANPEAYDSYRSPTYSIYGLYEGGDGKSRAGSLHK